MLRYEKGFVRGEARRLKTVKLVPRNYFYFEDYRNIAHG